MRYPILFALLTGMFWALYGPALAQARSALHSPFKPYFAIGLAYLVWATLGGMAAMRLNGDSFSFSGAGITWGFIAGTMGAIGAFTLTLAMFTGGTAMPQIVMPIVFGTAVTVSALVALRTAESYSPWLPVGIAVIAIGIVLVAYNTPHAAPPGAAPATTEAHD
jgi:drug/metabolite transporter (DMT)-like permease